MRLRGLRGAITADNNIASDIVQETTLLLKEMMNRNDIEEEDIVSIIFSATDDLNAEFPAAAARTLGFKNTPLLCTKEIAVPGSITKCIRILMHFYTNKNAQELKHVYLKGAKRLRTDLPE